MLDISIHRQKILVWFPALNILVMAVLVYRCRYYNLSIKHQLLTCLVGLVGYVPFIVLMAVMEAHLPAAADIINFCVGYIMGILGGWLAIWFQEKIGLNF